MWKLEKIWRKVSRNFKRILKLYVNFEKILREILSKSYRNIEKFLQYYEKGEKNYENLEKILHKVCESFQEILKKVCGNFEKFLSKL